MQRQGVCLLGYGETKFAREKRSVIEEMADAIRLALANAGLQKDDVNGLAVTSMAMADFPPFIAEQLGFELDWLQGVYAGGASGIISVRRAADAIQLGQIEIAVCVAGDVMNAHGVGMETYQSGNFVQVYGYGGPNSEFGLTQRLHMSRYGTTLEQIGQIAVSQRQNGILNDNAYFRSPLTMEGYLNSRIISDPIRLFDCVLPVSGATAIVVASEKKAKQMTERPVYLVADCEKNNYHVKDMMPDRLELGFKAFADQLFSKIKREELDFAQIYDDYPIAVLMQLEDLGFCPKGKGGEFIESHNLTIKGDFPLNTGGGQLSLGQPGLAGGHLHIAEAIRQLKGEAGRHQVKDAAAGLITGVGFFGYHLPLACTAAMILQRTKV